MITLPLTMGLWCMVLVPLAGILLASLFTGRRLPRRAGASRAHIYRCEHCRRVYVDERKVPISRCPGCRRLNEALRR